MATYVLVHGAYHGAWCWSRLMPKLTAAGHTVIAPDLPGHGDDPTPPGHVSMQAYAERIAAAAAAADEPVSLVGHSMGGAVIAAAAELAPDNVGWLIFLTAYIPEPGRSVAERVRQDTQIRIDVGRTDVDGVACLEMPEETARRHFYFDASEVDFADVRRRLQRQPMAPFIDPVSLSEARFGRVPRAYIHCRRDRAISFGLQRRMAAAVGCDPVLTLPSGHSPFITHTDELATALLTI